MQARCKQSAKRQSAVSVGGVSRNSAKRGALAIGIDEIIDRTGDPELSAVASRLVLGDGAGANIRRMDDSETAGSDEIHYSEPPTPSTVPLRERGTVTFKPPACRTLAGMQARALPLRQQRGRDEPRSRIGRAAGVSSPGPGLPVGRDDARARVWRRFSRDAIPARSWDGTSGTSPKRWPQPAAPGSESDRGGTRSGWPRITGACRPM